ncbi:MAG: hypothetical protein CMD96_03315 [Gammaproteobacteria bacterium]|jgi:hypothetical protein|nr:hypothetical protein [Gammaproteobacteria bacterium]|tara:strand:+ start:332 stop:739 length:408 start_codon:yes stop_codon:yes gene_type:complete
MKKLILISVLFLGTSSSFAQQSNSLEGKRLYEKTDGGREYFNFKSGDLFSHEIPEVTVSFNKRGIKYSPTGKMITENGRYEYDEKFQTLRIQTDNSNCIYELKTIGSRYILTPIEEENSIGLTACFQKSLKEAKR